MKKTKIILERIVDVIVLALGFISCFITLIPGCVLFMATVMILSLIVSPFEYIIVGKCNILNNFFFREIKDTWLFYWFLAPGFVAALVWVDNRKERRGDNI